MPDERRLEFQFRSGFWRETARRFSALEEFQMEIRHAFVHLESDMILSTSCKLAAFRDLPGKIKYPYLTPTEGIGSLFYSENVRSIRTFNVFLRRYLEENIRGTDMTALGTYARKYPNRVGILPTIIPGKATTRFEMGECSIAKKMSHNVAGFGGVFDGATLGQYLLGLDPRNGKGLRRLLHSPADHILDASALEIQLFDGNLFVGSQPGSSVYPVLSLHVHSKDLRAMRSDSRERLLAYRLRHRNRGPYSEFSVWGFFCWLKDSALRRGRYLSPCCAKRIVESR
jgi:hypothetical protein